LTFVTALYAQLSQPPARSGTFRDAEPISLAATLAAPYSGATLFAILLARHPEIASDGEIFPWGNEGTVVCSCGQAQIDCPYYRQAAGHMLEPGGRSWDRRWFAPHPRYSRFTFLDRAVGRLWGCSALYAAQQYLRSMVRPWREHDRAFVDAQLRFMENSLRLRGAQVYVDGSKSIRRALLFAASGQVRLKVIHLVRDGRAFCFSYLKNNKLPRNRLAAAARAWLGSIQSVDRFRARMPGVPVLNVRYEDLCRDLPATLHRLCQFLGLSYEPGLERPAAEAYHVLGNRMRMVFSGQIEECRRWQREFGAAEIDFLDNTMRKSLERYGYLGPIT
jgi:hypothetical protein